MKSGNNGLLKPNKLRTVFLGTYRRQLILGVALTNALLMSLFIWDLTYRQEAMYLERQIEHATALTQSLATSSAGWLAANDIAGLQELVEAQRRYPELAFAMLTNAAGHVLAHNDRQKIGLTLLDLPKSPIKSVFSADKELVDIAVPVILADRHVGWARVGVSQKIAGRKLAEMTYEGILYALAAIILGSIFAWLMGRRITRRLSAVQDTINKVKAGNNSVRCRVEGIDEAALLAQEFNAMLDALSEREGELELHRNHLEVLVEERTAELLLARDAASTANQAKSRFLANMSHEIRTPMNAVMGLLHLLQRTELLPRQQDYVKKTQIASHSLLSILNDILDFSKIEAGKLELEDSAVRIGELLRNLSVILSSAVQDKDVEVLFSIEGEIPQNLRGDGLRLQQVLLNLASNAIKFTEKGEVVISVRALTLTPEQAELEFAVRDTGIGIALELQEHIFDGFAQAEASTSRRFGGTGLGLSISRQLVGMMGGTLAVESEPGRGSTFHFTAKLKCDPKALPEASVAREIQAGTPSAAPVSTLIVDDNAIAREVLSSMAATLGWRVETASSGPEAIALINSRKNGRLPYDVVFMDWKMPGMDGWEATRQIRRIPNGDKATVVIMVTAHGREFMAERVSEEPSLLDGYLIKPFTPSMLFDAVADVRSGRYAFTNTPVAVLPNLRRLAGLRLLVVEDNLINQQVADEILSQEGAVVAVASGGRQALELLSQEEPFDAVLMDIQMPEMDGFETTRRIREELGMTELPIISMTANALPADREQCLAGGMNDHLGKPIDVDALIAVLRRYCDLTPEPATAARTADSALNPAHSGFDCDGTLRRMGNNRSLYARMARAFAKDLGADVERLRLKLTDGEQGNVRHELHTLKGVAATLGATALSRAAADAETALKNNSSPDEFAVLLSEVERLFKEACGVMQRVADELDPPGDAAEAAGLLDREALALRLVELEALLVLGNMRAMQIYQDIWRQSGAELREQIAPLNAAMQRLDFPAAVASCRKIREERA